MCHNELRLATREWAKRCRKIESHGTAFEGTNGLSWTAPGSGPSKELLDTKFNDTRLYESNNHAGTCSTASAALDDLPVDVAVQADTLCQIATSPFGRNRSVGPGEERFVNNDAANRGWYGRAKSWRL
jgi:hypothetical protein